MSETGPGVIRLDHRAHSGINLEWFHLDNFNIDEVTLKTRHRNYLSERFANNFLPTSRPSDLLIPADDVWIFLRGYASRTGGRDHLQHNLDLSGSRVENVRSYLIDNCCISNERITGLDYVGEEWSNGEIEEDDMFRSVEVISRTENRPPESHVVSFIYDRFRMRAKTCGPDILGAIAGELDIPGGIGSTILMIQIQNITTHETRTFLYISVQVTAGLSVPLPEGPSGTPRDITDHHSDYGDWVNFRTRSHRHVALIEFEGDASFGSMVSVQIGTYSPGESLGMGESYFVFQSHHLHSIESYVRVIPRTIVLPMPQSVGLSVSLISMSPFGRLSLWHD